jgi:outer membrane receptor protein involved in Fe transport
LQLDLENVLDKNYREHGSGIDAAGINLIASLRITL